METPLFRRATDPKQYDLPDLEWSEETGLESPYRAFFWSPFLKHAKEWKNSSLLDIGAGTGWLVNEVKKYGAKKVIGIEPSEKNREMAERFFPEAQLEDASLESLQTDEKYDGAFSVMSFPHIADLPAAMQKISSLLKKDGRFYLLVPDYDYYKRPRHDYAIDIEEITSEEFVIAVNRPSGKLADIVRRNRVYIGAANTADLKLVSQAAIPPTEELMERQPKYRAFEGTPLVQFLVFQKHSPKP